MNEKVFRLQRSGCTQCWRWHLGLNVQFLDRLSSRTLTYQELPSRIPESASPLSQEIASRLFGEDPLSSLLYPNARFPAQGPLTGSLQQPVLRMEMNMTTLTLGLRQIRSLGDGMFHMIFGSQAHGQNAIQQGESFAMKCLSCAPSADCLF